jgi:hypothetical protein
MKCRILNNENCEITNNYGNGHNGVDIVGGGYTLDYIVAHSDGKVVFHQDGLNNIKGSTGNASYGNCVKLDHKNGYQTLYAHMQKGLLVKNGQEIKKGQRLGYMSDSGNAYGKHLHFEVWQHGQRINPTEYLNKEFVVLKSVDEIAKEVIEGKWKNQPERQKLLENAGYNYKEVQTKVNQILNKKSVDEVARDVINGKYGNQPERQKRLEAEGYNYREVQNRVNQLLK